MSIKDINEGINWRTIPKEIQDEFSNNGHIRAETHTRNDKGVMEVTYGEIMRPLFMRFNYENLDFFINLKYWEQFAKQIHLGIVYDEDLNLITNKNINPFYIEYSNGFNKGYSEFEDTLKKDIPFFGNSNEHLTYRIYSRVINEKKGSFPLGGTLGSQTDLEKKIRKDKNLKILLKLNKESFFNSGFNGGEFYKAWEIILNNPTIFDPIFKASLETEIKQPEPQAIDLHKETKYFGQPTNDKANKFFEFLIEFYRPEEKTQVKYVNILHFLKKDANKKQFIFKLKQKDYKELIKSRGITIGKFEKSVKYEDEEKHIFYSLENNFLKNLIE